MAYAFAPRFKEARCGESCRLRMVDCRNGQHQIANCGHSSLLMIRTSQVWLWRCATDFGKGAVRPRIVLQRVRTVDSVLAHWETAPGRLLPRSRLRRPVTSASMAALSCPTPTEFWLAPATSSGTSPSVTRAIWKVAPAVSTSMCMSVSVEHGHLAPATWFREIRFSALRSQGNCALSTAIASAAVSTGGGVRGHSGARRARPALWLRAWALPPRAPRRRSCSRVLLKRIWEWLYILSPAITFICSFREHKQVKSGSPAQIHAMERRWPGKRADEPDEVAGASQNSVGVGQEGAAIEAEVTGLRKRLRGKSRP